MSYRITYTDERGRTREHRYSGHRAGAEGWAKRLSEDNGGRRAECVEIADGPYDHSGTVTHVITVGDNGKK